VLVVVFTYNYCPYTQAWEGRLIQLQRGYAERGVAFVAINANDPSSTLAIMAWAAHTPAWWLAAIRSIVARLRSTSSSVVAHDDTLIRMAFCPCQTVPPHQQVPSA
jgi:hypothetical protein